MPNPANYPDGSFSDPSAPWNQPDYPETWDMDDREWDAHNHDWQVFLERLYEHGFPDDYPPDTSAWVVVKRAAAEAEAARLGYELHGADVIVNIDLPDKDDERAAWCSPQVPDDAWPDGIPIDDIQGYATFVQVKMREVTGVEWRRKHPASSREILGNSPRDAVLHGALKAVSTRDNEAAYGTGNSFDAAARIKAAILSACREPPPPAVEIAITQIAVKLARLAGSGFKHEDSWVDFCGYGAWAFQLATETDPNGPKP